MTTIICSLVAGIAGYLIAYGCYEPCVRRAEDSAARRLCLLADNYGRIRDLDSERDAYKAEADHYRKLVDDLAAGPRPDFLDAMEKFTI